MHVVGWHYSKFAADAAFHGMNLAITFSSASKCCKLGNLAEMLA